MHFVSDLVVNNNMSDNNFIFVEERGCQALHCQNGGFCDGHGPKPVCYCTYGYTGDDCRTGTWKPYCKYWVQSIEVTAKSRAQRTFLELIFSRSACENSTNH